VAQVLSKYGDTLDQIPEMCGRVFWVAPTDTYPAMGSIHPASDRNSGLSPDKACRTINHVIDNLVKSDAGDVVLLLPGTHEPKDSSGTDAQPVIDSSGVTITGIPGGRGNYLGQRSRIGNDNSSALLNVTAANVEISHLYIQPGSARNGVVTAAGGDNLHVHNCYFDMHTAAVNTSTRGVNLAGGVSGVLIEDCYFVSDGAQGEAIHTQNATASIFQGCTFSSGYSAGTWAAAITVGSAAERIIIRDNQFIAGNSTMGICIQGTTSGVVGGTLIARNSFPDSTAVANKAIDGYDGGDADIVNNFTAGLGSGDGGVIVTTTT